MTITLQEIVDKVEKALPGAVLSHQIKLGELSLSIEKVSILKVLTYLKDEPTLGFRQLIDLCGVDYPEREERFDVVYHLLSHTQNLRIRLKVSVSAYSTIETCSYIFSTANWFEREAFDLFGIPFTGHPDLRRILTDYDFQGHPLRKDFPLSGFVEPRYDEEMQRVVYSKIQLPQEYRQFDFLSPWAGMTMEPRVLPGDEKATKA